MAIVYEKLLNLAIPTIEQTYAPNDAMLYALGVGLGLDPMDRGQLDFVFEKNLKVLPTFAVVLAHPGLWVRDLDTGIDAVKVVHGEQGLIPAQAIAVERRIDRQVADNRRRRQRRGSRRPGHVRAQNIRSCDRRTPRHRHSDSFLPWRRRLRRPFRSKSEAA
jgi:hypothetical protein